MKKPDTITCEEAMQHLFDYLDNELAEGVHHKMDEHLSTCQSCYSRMEFEKRLKSHLQNMAEEKAPEAFKERIKKLVSEFQGD
ncbi:MAG: anti-sigma factor [Halobacteria archaeon]|nr:anti-sigma factor [Halobacteria archaeon]